LATILVVLVGYYFIIQSGQTGTDRKPSGFRSFFPFGGNDNATTSPREVVGDNTPEEELNFTQKLRKLSSEPVSGAGILDVKAGSIVRYIEKATGHIFEVEMFSPNQNRISNTTIPLAYDAIWGNKNTSLVVRYLKDDDVTVDTYALTIKEVSTSTENNVSAVSFPANISGVSGLNNSMFYLQQTDNSSVGFISNFSGKNRKQIWNSEIKELNSQYINPKTVSLTTKPARNISGFMYFVDTGTGQVKKILGDIVGLSTLTDSDANQVLYLTQGDGVQLSVFNQKSKSFLPVTPTTFPEKCVWSKRDKSIVYCAVPEESLDGSSLTFWYQGVYSFGDYIWKYDIKNNISSIVSNLYDESSERIDVIKPILSENEQYLIFLNKMDNSLWSLDLTKEN